MNLSNNGYHGLNEAELKQYAFCRGGFDQFYDEHAQIGGCYFAYCHVLGELSLQAVRVPTMSFISQVRREQFRQQLGEIGRRAMRHVKIEEVTRVECREVVDLAVADFSAKGRARDVLFLDRPNPLPPSGIEVRQALQQHQTEYRRFLDGVRKRVYAGINLRKPNR